jgi:hypothetical protein
MEEDRMYQDIKDVLVNLSPDQSFVWMPHPPRREIIERIEKEFAVSFFRQGMSIRCAGPFISNQIAELFG